jgi:hypothetical protein
MKYLSALLCILGIGTMSTILEIYGKDKASIGLFICLSCLFYVTFKNLSELEIKENK